MVNARGFQAWIVVTSLLGCQPPSQRGETGAPSAGQTTYSRGNSTTVVSDTTRAGGDTTSRAPATGAALSLDRTRYAAGAQVQMRVTSETFDTLGFNPCARSLERQDGGRWVVQNEGNRICTMELWLLEPNKTRLATTDLPASLSSGHYRMVVLLSRQRMPPPGAARDWGTVRAVSSTFRVE